MNHVFADLEMNPISRQYEEQRKWTRSEIMEIGAVRLDENDKEIDSFCAYVRPQYSTTIYPKYVKLTGISWEMVENAEPLSAVLPKFSAWCGRDCDVYSWSDSDIWQILNETWMKKIPDTEDTRYILNHWKDFQRQFCDLFHISGVLSLDKAVYYAGIDFEGRAHDGLVDARNTARLFVQSRDSEGFRKLRKIIDDAFSDHPTTMGDLFDFGSIRLNP